MALEAPLISQFKREFNLELSNLDASILKRRPDNNHPAVGAVSFLRQGDALNTCKILIVCFGYVVEGCVPWCAENGFSPLLFEKEPFPDLFCWIDSTSLPFQVVLVPCASKLNVYHALQYATSYSQVHFGLMGVQDERMAYRPVFRYQCCLRNDFLLWFVNIRDMETVRTVMEGRDNEEDFSCGIL